jgi:hypothetical protein
MTTRHVKLYPTPANCQRVGDVEWPLDWAIQYLTILYKSLSPDEQRTAVIRSMADVQIWRDKTLTPHELDSERLSYLLADLNSRIANGQDASVDDLRALMSGYQALSS